MSATGPAAVRSPDFDYRGGILHIESLNLELLAQRFGTPLYVYSRAAITAAWLRFSHAFEGNSLSVRYAVKANSNLAILQLLAKLGAGFDIVSVGELERVLRAGGDPTGIVFSGVGKREDEMRRALEVGIQCFNVESEAELLRLSVLAGNQGKPAAVALRINPQVETGTHPHIATGHRDAKFGIDIQRAEALYRQATKLPGIRIIGIACHIGSQITQPAPFLDAARRIMALVDNLLENGSVLQQVDLGGGFGVRYRDESQLDVTALIGQLRQLVEKRGLKLILEPGRALVAEAGVLLTRVEYLKTTDQDRFAIVDAGMTELIRPPLYNAWHEIRVVTQRPGMPSEIYDVVGPVCESADTLGRDRQLTVQTGDLLAIMDAGAYGFSMSSNYNSRPRAAEVLVDGDHANLIRRRETLDELITHEELPC
ncbi:MAG TPA: diaminopimelate decarboxylase [Gammaproteobacteria bacterium]|nr:diaminopimelate decarboxylase [Gammaproteobacteria bacterium]